jgi:hypothetical protein
MGVTLSRLLAAGGYVSALYAAAVLLAVLVGCLADEHRRADARRVLALLLFRPVEPDSPKRRPPQRPRDVEGRTGGKGRAELPSTPDAEP